MSDQTHPAMRHKQSWGSPGYTDRHRIKQLISELFHSYARKPSDEITDTWAEQLKAYSAKQVEDACQHLIRTKETMPSLSSLLIAVRPPTEDSSTEDPKFLAILKKQRADHQKKREEIATKFGEDFVKTLTEVWCKIRMGKDFAAVLPKEFQFKDFEYAALKDWYLSAGNKDLFKQLAEKD